MAMRCDNCGKGIIFGHAVSHAKNRTKRIFKPNLQKLHVLINGKKLNVKLCTRCIKKLKNSGKIGPFTKYVKKEKPDIKIVPKIEPKIEEKKEAKKAKDTLSIESIVGKRKE